MSTGSGTIHIEVSSKSLLALINDVLDFSKIEAGEMQLERHAFSLPGLLADLDSLFTPVAASKGITLDISAIADEIPRTLVSDGQRLRQILTNLLSNAIKITDHGQVSLRVSRLAAEDNRVTLRFAVIDTGIGIAPEALPELFKPFIQGDSATNRQYEGTGLGLSIVNRLAELMGATIGVDSRPGQGAIFWLDLPCEVASTSVPEEGLERLAAPPGEVGESLAGVRVLVVDDAPMNLDVIGRILASAGALPTTCESGEAALATLRNSAQPYDAILMDLQMPGMDGCATTVKIRQDSACSKLPIIALTAGATTTEQQRAYDAGMDDFLTKPVDPGRLVQAVGYHVERYRGRPLLAAEVACLATPVPVAAATDGWLAMPGIDPVFAKRMFAGDFDFFRQAKADFIAANSDALGEVHILLSAGERDEAARRVHKLRGQAANLGAMRLGAAAGMLETALDAGQIEIDNELAEFAEAHAEVFGAPGDSAVRG